MALKIEATEAKAKRRLFTVEEFHLMGEAGIFTEDDRVELVGGEILEMSPVGRKHITCVDRLNRLFNRLLGDSAIVRVQSPLPLGANFEPVPDVTLLKWRDDFYAYSEANPADVLLVVEVSDTTLRYDRSVKLPFYARAGVDEVWVVNLPQQVIEVYSEPREGKYTQTSKVRHGQRIQFTTSLGPSVEAETILGPAEARR